MERFLAIKQISDCTSAALKEALVRLLTKHNLPISRLRGHGYDGASNMPLLIVFLILVVGFKLACIYIRT